VLQAQAAAALGARQLVPVAADLALQHELLRCLIRRQLLQLRLLDVAAARRGRALVAVPGLGWWQTGLAGWMGGLDGWMPGEQGGQV
jgi:hypothetical protein